MHETRLAEAGFARDQHHLSRAFLRLFPGLGEQADLGITAGQRRERRRESRLDFAINIRPLLRVGIGYVDWVHGTVPQARMNDWTASDKLLAPAQKGSSRTGRGQSP